MFKLKLKKMIQIFWVNLFFSLPVFASAPIDNIQEFDRTADFFESRNDSSLPPIESTSTEKRPTPGSSNRTMQEALAIPITQNLQTLLQTTPLEKKLTTQPWSNTYWPFYLGGLAWRYEDPSAALSTRWSENESRFHLPHHQDPGRQSLSAAEKYDYLIGDDTFSFTRFSWSMGRRFLPGIFGETPLWRGICHGWAAAALLEERPTHSISIRAANGNFDLQFNPIDIKGLLSLLYAKGDYPSIFFGKRCERSSISVESGGIIDNDACFDLHPATLFLLATHAIGKLDRGFVLDIDPLEEVWNQPVLGYKITYFSPATGEDVHSITDATIAINQLPERHPFRERRTRSSTQVIGIKMTLQYSNEYDLPEASARPPLFGLAPFAGRRSDSPVDDIVSDYQVAFDLELDATGSIVGGEYYHSDPKINFTPEGQRSVPRHPDFAWIPNHSLFTEQGHMSYPRERSDRYQVELWDGVSSLREYPRLKFQAKKAAQDGQPLRQITRKLLESSRRPE